jgi:peptidoglycan/xylan/chitin deacetylase (PgdA/CDA1 family)
MTTRQRGSGRPEPADIDPDVYLYERYQTAAPRRRALNAYYAIKPLVPRSIQIGTRRLHARRARRGFPGWPIEPILVEHQHSLWRASMAERSVARLPLLNYWPDGHRFAVTVTHDVESRAGIDKIEALLEIERERGISAAWNFVAEWYPIPTGTFERVRDAGGEIGLHGLSHDGALFRDHGSFESQLPAIHRYMQEWGAVGFRSPATNRNAEWMHEFTCLYDSSFPDSDPYAPQPGGCCSILPYFYGSVVELPITLVQDHTLWEILQQTNIDLWRQKGDWVIANHGLINLIVHPDYASTPHRLALYGQLLDYLRERIDSLAGWHALPRDVADWWNARSRMGVVDDGGARVLDRGPAGAWSERATLAWVSEQRGVISIDA